jgi:hypothetical protein
MTHRQQLLEKKSVAFQTFQQERTQYNQAIFLNAVQALEVYERCQARTARNHVRQAYKFANLGNRRVAREYIANAVEALAG